MQNPNITLICLPYAGGNRYSYRPYQPFLPDHVTLVALDYTGHGARMKASPLINLQQIALDAYAQVQHLLDTPYAIYGHSMGARVAHLLAREIQARQQPLPLGLFLSGSEAPAAPCPHAGNHLLPRAEFFEALKKMGGMPPDVLQHQELMALFEPVLRADFQAISDYQHQPGAPLDIPLTILSGHADDIGPEDIARWQEETLQPIHTRYFDGGHFFILEHAQAVVAECMLRLQKTILSI